MPTFPAHNDSSYRDFWDSQERSLNTSDQTLYVPQTIDRELFFTVGYGLSSNSSCSPLPNCTAGFDGYRILGAVNNITFVTPSSSNTSLLQYAYLYDRGVSTSNSNFDLSFPDDPESTFNYTGPQPPLSTRFPEHATRLSHIDYNSNVQALLLFFLHLLLPSIAANSRSNLSGKGARVILQLTNLLLHMAWFFYQIHRLQLQCPGTCSCSPLYCWNIKEQSLRKGIYNHSVTVKLVATHGVILVSDSMTGFFLSGVGDGHCNLQLVLQDTSILLFETHPFHLHGFSFYIVGRGYGNYDPAKSPATFNLVNPPYRNTFGVNYGGWIAIRFQADNPGLFMQILISASSKTLGFIVSRKIDHHKLCNCCGVDIQTKSSLRNSESTSNHPNVLLYIESRLIRQLKERQESLKL